MVLSGLIIPTLLIIVALSWLYAMRPGRGNALHRAVTLVSLLPAWVWMLLGVAAFVLPVLEYWITARSHGNALAGFLPWADATEYFQCSEVFLLGLDGPAHCGKRPYYFAFFADLLWFSGNDLQIALLLQALMVGAVATLFAYNISRTLNTAASLAAYSVLFVYAAALCSGLVMTENIGLILGTLGILLLWQHARAPNIYLFICGVAILAAAMGVRPGPLFVLPALGAWYLFYGNGPPGQRFLVAVCAGIASALAMVFVASPVLVAGGTLGSTHSNFSYSLYGLVVGGKGWLQVTVDHPEIFNRSDGISQTDKVYQLALQSLREKPHLFVLGYIKGIAKYFDALFRYTSDFKPLRLGLLLPLWVCGAWYVLRRWREPSCSMLLAILAGIIVSSPFLIYDAHNRAFASVAPVDALFVAMGICWVADTFSKVKAPAGVRPLVFSSGKLAGTALAAMALPVVMLAAIRPGEPYAAVAPPACPDNALAVVVQPGKSSPVLHLVGDAGETSVSPLRVQADLFAGHLHKWVHRKHELALPAGSKLVWGIRLDNAAPGERIYFNWPGDLPTANHTVGFCVEHAPGAHVGTATSIHASLR